MDNEVSLTVEDLGTLSDMLERANDSGGTVVGTFRFSTTFDEDAVVSIAFDSDRGEHAVTVSVFHVYDE